MKHYHNIPTLAKAFAMMIAMVMAFALKAGATGWPAHYGGVMLQGFYWHSYDLTAWKKLGSDATVNDYSKYFDVIWVPQSGKLSYDQTGMGYQPYYWFDQNTQAFGSQSDLQKMISAYKKVDTYIIEDVVINHHCSRNELDYFFFPNELNPEDGKYYQLLPSDICANDDNGNAKAMLRGDQKLSSNNDEGEDFSYGRDIDHKSKHAQDLIKAYQHYLVNTIGYTGFRYDMVKGFNGGHIADYNYTVAEATKDAKNTNKFRFSVGEYWDSSLEKVWKWINSTIRDINGKTDVDNGKDYFKNTADWDAEAWQSHIYSAAFDYPLKHGAINSAFATGDFSRGGNKFANFGIADGGSPANSRYAITFVENHDTYYPRDDGTVTDNGNMAYKYPLAANALILALPGTPCIFLQNWIDTDMRPELEKMIMARKACGVTNMSIIEKRDYDIDNDGYYVIVDSDPYVNGGFGNGNAKKVDGKMVGQNKILVTFGDVSKTGLTDGYTLISPSTEAEAKKLGYHFYIKGVGETTETNNAVYRYNQYISETQTANPYAKINAKATLDDKLYAQDTIHHKAMVNLDKTIYVHRVKYPEQAPYIFTWSPELAGSWPGTKMTKSVTIKGEKYWYYTFTSGEALNFVINDGGPLGDGNNQNQTSDIKGITGDSYIVWDDNYTAWKDKDGNQVAHWTLTTGTEKSAQLDPDSVFMSDQTLTAFFTKPAGWTGTDAPRIYAYNASGSFTAAAPGDVMKEVGVIDGKTVWRWSYTGDKYNYEDATTAPTQIVFSDGVNSTNALAFENQKYYDGTTLASGTAVTPSIAASASVPDGLKGYNTKFTIWAEAPSALGTPRVYAWYDGGEYAKWDDRPQMEFVKTLDNGNRLFRYDYAGAVTSTPTGLKITCGASQTGDLKYSATANYYKLDEPLKMNKPMYTVYFKKPAGWWGTPNAWVYKDGDGGENLTQSLGYSWPGQPMEEVGKINGESVYKWSYYGTSETVPDKVIFNFEDNTLNPRGSKFTYKAQTDALAFEDGKLYNGSRRPASCVKNDGDPYTCWLVLPSNVEKGYAWPVTKDWKDNYTQNGWPGDEMTATTETVGDLTVVKWTYNASITTDAKQTAAKDNPPYMTQLIFKEKPQFRNHR